MYSKARVGKHPIHPMLVAFPIALYTATVAALLANIATEDPFWYRAALTTNLAGIGMALLAVIPGAIDLFTLKLPASARRTGLQHAGMNILGTGLFAVCAVLLWHGWRDRMMVDGYFTLDATIPLAVAVLGFLATVGAGMFGWALVQTHHLGIIERPQPTAVGQIRTRDAIDDLEEMQAYDYETPANDPHDTERTHAIH